MKTFSIAIGSDHAGFNYKEAIKAALLADGHTVRDLGTYSDAITRISSGLWRKPSLPVKSNEGSFWAVQAMAKRSSRTG